MKSSKRPRIENQFDIIAPLCDLTLIAALDQAKVPVVRGSLTQKSVYFEKLLGPRSHEGAQQEVIIQEIDGPTLKTMIKFIYWPHQSIDLTRECVASILDGAARMELVTLKKLCRDFLRKNLSEENCFRTFVLADKHSFDALKASALELVGVHFESIPKSEVLQVSGHVLGEILKCGRICAAETSLFNLLIEWVERNEIVRSRFMPNLLKSFRFEYLPGEFILTVVEPMLKRYESSELIHGLYEELMRNHNPSIQRRYDGKLIVKSVFLADIVNGQCIDIYKCYPNSQQLPSIPITSSRINQGWTFYDGRFYVMGGHCSADRRSVSREVECIDMDTKECTKLPNMLNARSSFQPVVSGKYIYVFGGQNLQGLITDCERFDTKSNQWEALPAMPVALQNYVGIGIKGNVFIVGGSLNYTTEYRCKYDSGKNRWSHLTRFYACPVTDVTILKQEDAVINVITNSPKISGFETRRFPSSSLQTRDLMLPGIEICKIMECDGSPYIFYKFSGELKFGRIDFNGDDCKIVDYVQSSAHFTTGSLFMR